MLWQNDSRMNACILRIEYMYAMVLNVLILASICAIVMDLDSFLEAVNQEEQLAKNAT